MSLNSFEQLLPSELDTDALGNDIASLIRDGIIIYLVGDLGAGKTRLAQGIIHGLGFSGHVKSPTYTLVESYRVNDSAIFHFDLYRLMDPMELEFMGIQDYFDYDNIILIEWPDKGAGMIEQADVRIHLDYAEQSRKVLLTSETERGAAVINKLKQNL